MAAPALGRGRLFLRCNERMNNHTKVQRDYRFSPTPIRMYAKSLHY